MNLNASPRPASREAAATGSRCLVCGKVFPVEELTPADIIRPRLARLIRRDHREWNDSARIYQSDLNRYRVEYVRVVLEAETGELSVLEDDVIKSLRDHELVASNVHKEFETRRTFGERVADKLAAFGGSWKFIVVFSVLMIGWILLNVLIARRAPDPYPYILLNLALFR